jgi:cytoskeletal protein RodZ
MTEINFDAFSNLGKKLADARVKLGLSVEDVARELKLSPQKIAGFESGEIIKMPMVYLRGHLLAYAKFLGVFTKEIQQDFNRLESVIEEPVVSKTQIPEPEAIPEVATTAAPRQNVRQQFVLLLIFAFLLCVIGWLKHEKSAVTTALHKRHMIVASDITNYSEIKL